MDCICTKKKILLRVFEDIVLFSRRVLFGGLLRPPSDSI